MTTIEKIDSLFENLASKDDKLRYAAFKEILELTENKVKWFYDKFYLLTEKLSSENSYQRSIGFMVLANLCKSDDENRIQPLLPELLKQLNDEKFITSRQSIQAVWKFALNNEVMKSIVLKALKNEFYENRHLSTHGNLIKQDIIGSLKLIADNTNDVKILSLISDLISEENDPKLQKALKKIAKLK